MARSLNIRLAVGRGKKRSCGGGCYSIPAVLSSRHFAVESVQSRIVRHTGAPRPIPLSRRAQGKSQEISFD